MYHFVKAARAQRLVQGIRPIEMVDGTRVADDWDDLTDGSIQNAINLDETGSAVAAGAVVFTLTNADGSRNGSFTDCEDWTSTSGAISTLLGFTDRTDSGWTAAAHVVCGPGASRLYCLN